MSIMTTSSSSLHPVEKKKKKNHHWWLTNSMLVDKYLREASTLMAKQDHCSMNSALDLIDAGLALSPRLDEALELKVRALLSLRRFSEVADMLQDYIPSYCNNSYGNDIHSYSSLNGKKLFSCFSADHLKRKLFLAGISNNCDRGQLWRYLLLGQACSYLGLMEDALVLLQAARHIAAVTSRRQSIYFPEDNFTVVNNSQSFHEFESFSHLLSHIKLLLRRKTSAIAGLNAGLHAESIRNFSKVINGRHHITTPANFAANCFIGRAKAYRATGRLADAMGDCNRALAIDKSLILALKLRANIFEAIGAFVECLHDLDHLKLLYQLYFQDHKLPGPVWAPQPGVQYRNFPSRLKALSRRIQGLRDILAEVDGCNIDNYALLGVQRGCSRSELERAHKLLIIKHEPEKSLGFLKKLEFADDYRTLDAIRNEARMSALVLYRMIQKGYDSILNSVIEDELAEKKRENLAHSNETVALPESEPVPKKDAGVVEMAVEEDDSNISDLTECEIAA